MRALLLAASLAPVGALFAPSAAFAGDLGVIPADWRALDVPLGEEELDGLRKLGFRLDPDGRVLDLELKVLDAAGLAEARRLLTASTRQQRLERLRSLLAAQPQGAPLSPAARAQALQLADRGLFTHINRNDLTVAALRRIANLDLAEVARVFDGALSRTAGTGVVAVAAPDSPPAQRPHFPYLTMSEQQAGESLRAATVTRLSTLERGRLILSRLDGDLPPILVESIGTAARYDGNRHALVLDRDVVIAELLHGVLPVDFAARRREFAQADGLARALAADPAAVRRVIERQDVLVAHELTHAWQDRRDNLYRQMAKGGVPRAVVLEYEEEAFVEKNLYLHEKLKEDPGAYVDPMEMDDYTRMMGRYDMWRDALFQSYRQTDPTSNDIPSLREIQERRLRDLRNSPVNSTAEQVRKARYMLRMTRGANSLAKVETEHARRIEALKSGPLATSGNEHNRVMARHHLRLALNESNDIQRIVHLDHARSYAEASGDSELLSEVQSQMGRRR